MKKIRVIDRLYFYLTSNKTDISRTGEWTNTQIEYAILDKKKPR